MSEAHSQGQLPSSLAGLTLGAIGVVYGDIGTSVLYSIKEVFGSGHVAFTPDNVYGILSIFFWTLTFIVSLKYVTLVLRADNNGEGGLVAMLALASSSVRDKPKLRRVLLVVGIFGTCLFYGEYFSKNYPQRSCRCAATEFSKRFCTKWWLCAFYSSYARNARR